MLAGDAAEIVDKAVGCLRHVQHLGRGRRPAPTGRSSRRRGRAPRPVVPLCVAGLRSGRIGGDNNPAGEVHTTGHQRNLRAAVATGGGEQQPMAWPGEVESSAKSTALLVLDRPGQGLLTRAPLRSSERRPPSHGHPPGDQGPPPHSTHAHKQHRRGSSHCRLPISGCAVARAPSKGGSVENIVLTSLSVGRDHRGVGGCELRRDNAPQVVGGILRRGGAGEGGRLVGDRQGDRHLL
jgi:hypothetical protein